MEYNKLNVAILTNFQDLNPGYSLTGIVLDQAMMLLKNGHNVHLLVSEQYNKKYDYYLRDRIGEKYVNQFTISPIVTFGHLIDYESSLAWTIKHKVLSCDLAETLVEYFTQHGIQVAFTHDWIFTGWNLPYAGGVRFTSHLLPHVAWLHWVHSVPSAARDWWKLNFYGPQHKIVFPNITDSRRVAEQFHTTAENVYCIPHIKDPRVWWNFSDATNDIIDKYPKLMTAEMVQVYPASTDRLSAKGVDKLIKIFGIWKSKGIPVCLLIANQWATGKSRREDIEQFKKIARHAGLEEDEFGFTSEFKENYVGGISTKVLGELQLLQNIFIYPTSEESFGLVGPEAAASGALIITNESLEMMREVFSNTAYPLPFGSYHNIFEPQQGWDQYLENAAFVIMNKYIHESAMRAKVKCKQLYNMDALYVKSYLPSMMGVLAIASSMPDLNETNREIIEDEMKNFRAQLAGNAAKKEVAEKVVELKSLGGGLVEEVKDDNS